MNIIKVPYLLLKKYQRDLQDEIGKYLIKKWMCIEKKNITTVEDKTLNKVFEIYTYTFNNSTAQIKKYSKMFKNLLYLIKDQENVIGYCGYYIKPVLTARGLKKKSVIYSIAIEKKYRGHKYGEKLLAESIEEMRLNKIYSVLLYVNIKNITALKLYKKMGFIIIEELPEICGQGEKCYKMELKLS